MAEVVILVTGMPGSGKDEFIKIAMSEGFADFHMGNVVREYFESTGESLSDSSVGKFASSERQTNGMDVWAQRTSKKLNSGKSFVIEGLRNYEELEFFKRSFPKAVLVGVFASRSDRFSRILRRHRADDATDVQGLIGRDERELSWGIGKLIALSDYVIVNDSDLDGFMTKSRDLIRKIADS